MGNSSPNLQDEEEVGYRVLGVQANSPASKGGLVSFFDFLVAANGIPLKSLDTTFIELIKASEDKPLPITVYNIKNRSLREIVLVPSKNWPGEGMLGVTIRFDTYHDAEYNLCHILDVEADSPAELAGLVPETDYLLGTAEKVFKDTDVLYLELKENVDKPVEFYVYNSERDEVRVVLLMPTDDWGGEGILGAGVAHGFLHGLPSSCCNTIGMANEESTHRVINSPFGYNSAEVSTDSADPASMPYYSNGQGSPGGAPVPLPPHVGGPSTGASAGSMPPPPTYSTHVHNIQLQAKPQATAST
jgi:hypothetical protein